MNPSKNEEEIVKNTSKRLFTSLKLGNITLAHRVIMAPLTRCRSPGGVPNDLNIKYYTQRASAGGLLITEGTLISPMAGSFPTVPGIYTPEQVKAWKAVTDSVHAKDGFIYCQLWHVGRATVPSVLPNNVPPFSSVAKSLKGKAGLCPAPNEYVVPPQAMTLSDMQQTCMEYRHAARCAIEAGFDGVEIHSANGYLLDQFIQDILNDRDDSYGGADIADRIRFPLQVVQAIVDEVGSDRVGIRFAPWGTFQEMGDSDPIGHWTYLCAQLKPFNLAYVHFVEPRDTLFESSEARLEYLRSTAEKAGRHESEFISLSSFKRELGSVTPIITAGGGIHAMQDFDEGDADAVVFGRLFISNPDLPYRLANAIALTRYERETFYTQGETGYTTYTAHA